MKRNFDNKLTDIKLQEQARRTELAMLYHLIDKYPREAREKAGKLPFDNHIRSKVKKEAI